MAEENADVWEDLDNSIDAMIGLVEGFTNSVTYMSEDQIATNIDALDMYMAAVLKHHLAAQIVNDNTEKDRRLSVLDARRLAQLAEKARQEYLIFRSQYI